MATVGGASIQDDEWFGEGSAFDSGEDLAAALFALVHLEWQLFLPIGFVGMVLAFVRYRSGSIVPTFVPIESAAPGSSRPPGRRADRRWSPR